MVPRHEGPTPVFPVVSHGEVDAFGAHQIQRQLGFLLQTFVLLDEVVLDPARLAVDVHRPPMLIVPSSSQLGISQQELDELLECDVTSVTQGLVRWVFPVLCYYQRTGASRIERVHVVGEFIEVPGQESLERVTHEYVFGVRFQPTFILRIG